MTLPAEYIAAACEGKHPYPTARQAYKAASKRAYLSHYRCQNCGMWHIGTLDG